MTNDRCLFFVHFKDIDDCVTARCVNGATCVDGVNRYSCTCNEGFTGTFCESGKIEKRLMHNI